MCTVRYSETPGITNRINKTKSQPPGPQNVIVFGGWTFKEVNTIKMRSYVWTFIEHDGCPFKKRLGHRWHPTPVLLPGKSHGRRSLVGCSPWGHEESDTTEQLRFHFSLSCIGEGNGNPLQCSCLENPRDGGAWWAAVSGVAQSRTRLKQLSSSSSRRTQIGAQTEKII